MVAGSDTITIVIIANKSDQFAFNIFFSIKKDIVAIRFSSFTSTAERSAIVYRKKSLIKAFSSHFNFITQPLILWDSLGQLKN